MSTSGGLIRQPPKRSRVRCSPTGPFPLSAASCPLRLNRPNESPSRGWLWGGARHRRRCFVAVADATLYATNPRWQRVLKGPLWLVRQCLFQPRSGRGHSLRCRGLQGSSLRLNGAQRLTGGQAHCRAITFGPICLAGTGSGQDERCLQNSTSRTILRSSSGCRWEKHRRGTLLRQGALRHLASFPMRSLRSEGCGSSA